MEKARRMINSPSHRIRKTMRTMEEMDTMSVDPESIGGSMKSKGKKWTEFEFYKNCKYTLERRNEL